MQTWHRALGAISVFVYSSQEDQVTVESCIALVMLHIQKQAIIYISIFKVYTILSDFVANFKSYFYPEFATEPPKFSITSDDIVYDTKKIAEILPESHRRPKKIQLCSSATHSAV